MAKAKKIVFTGGGTVGHVTLNLILIPKFLKDGWEVHYIGDKHGIEHEQIDKSGLDVTFHSIATGKLRRYFSWQNMLDVFKVGWGILQSIAIIAKIRPQALFSKGGFVSVPPVIASKLLGVPVYVHESDLSMGLANKIAYKFATTMFTTFEQSKGLAKTKHVGAITKVGMATSNQSGALDKIKEQNARLVAADDKAIEEGDQATIDFEGFVDGVAFEGGKGEDYPLTIGSHSFIDTFEDQLVGKKVGEEVEVNVTFPEEYQAKELAGKPAMFKVTIKEIKVKEYPKVDDEFAQEVSEFDTLAEYKADIKKDLVAKKKEAAAAEKESKVIEEIVKNSEMDIPEKMIEAQAQQMVEEFAQNIAMQGISFDQYMQFTGSTVEQLLEQVKPQAKARIESSLVLEEVVKAEKIEATDEEFEKELEDMATRYQMEKEKVAELLSDDDKKNLRNDICLKKAAKFVTSKAK